MTISTEDFEKAVDAALTKNKKILAIDNDIATLKSDVSTLKSDVSTLKSDVATLKSDVSTLKGDVSTLKTDVHHQGLLYESMQSDIKLILDTVIPLRKQSETFADLVSAMNGQDVRLAALESAFKHHTQDKRAHS